MGFLPKAFRDAQLEFDKVFNKIKKINKLEFLEIYFLGKCWYQHDSSERPNMRKRNHRKNANGCW
jgi:hypothetical protein